MPLSYAQYAGNGSTTTFSVPFPYILKAHVKVYLGFNILNGTYTSELVDGTGFTWTSGTQIQCTTAPAVGQTLTVIRQTPSSSRLVDWNDGSNLIAADLDTADLQNLYVVQEQQDRNDSGITQSTAATAAATAATTAANTATSTANTALSTSNTALTNANAAVSTANTASTNASAAVSTANTASTNASAAVTTANAASSTANTASTNASNAVTTANAAAANASTALSTANTALSTANAATSTANTASSNASAAVTTANTASTNASNAVTTANTASTNASAAVSTANTASTNATTAVNTANTANNKADQAIAAVSNSINYQLKANVAAIPASPANDTYIEVQDSTGLEGFTPLAGMPAGFVGDSGLSVRLRYTSAGSTWNWLNYYANNSDSRYLKLTGGTLTGQIKADDSTSAATPGYAFDGDPNTGVGRPGADELALITGGTARLTIDSAGNVAVAGALTKGGNNVVTVGDSGTVTSAMLADGTIVNADINAAAAIDKTKISGTAITAADTGTVTSTMIADGTIVNADVNASAAIAGTKISPDFGSQTITTTGVVSAALGAAATPSLTFTGDTNTGIYSPGADQVAISTGGSGRLFVNSSGQVGVGTNSPNQLLDVRGNAQVGQTGENFFNIRSASGSGQFLFFTESGVNDRWLMGSPAGSGDLVFRSGAYNFSTGSERLRITSAGLVGVGTSSPGQALTVNGNIETQNAGYVRSVGTGSDSAGVGPNIGVNSSSAIYYIQQLNASNGLDFWYYNAGWNKRLTLDSSGRLGIGTSSPAEQLELAKGSERLMIGADSPSGYSRIAARNTANSGYRGFQIDGSDLLINSNTSGNVIVATGGGKVGIGSNATSPSQQLHVRTDQAAYTWARIDNQSSSASAYSGLALAASGNTWGLAVGSSSANSNALAFVLDATGTNSEKMRLDTSGRLLVGTSTVYSDYNGSSSGWSGNLVVARNVYDGVAQFQNWNNAANLNSEGGTSIFISRSKSGTVGTHTALASGDDIGSLIFNASDGSNFRTAASIKATCDAGVSGGDVPGRLVFSVTADGASSPSEAVRISNSRNTSFTGAILPSADNSYQCGASGQRWSLIYAANGTIQTSDSRDKTDVTSSTLGADFIKKLNPVSYKFIVGKNKEAGFDEDGNRIYEPVPGQRTHWGFIAQEVKEAADESGVDFGGWILTDTEDPESQQGLRYDQFIAPLTKALQEALAEIDVLKAKVAALESA